MSLIRFRQPIVTRVTPHNGNRRYAVPNGGRSKGAPVVKLHAWEWEFRSSPNGWLTVPVPTDINTSSYEISCRVRPRVRASDMPVINTAQFTLKYMIISNLLTFRLTIGSTNIDATGLAIEPGQNVNLSLIFMPGDTTGQAFIIVDDVIRGSGTYQFAGGVNSPLYFGNVGTTTPAAPFQGVIDNISVAGGGRWPVHDGTGTVIADHATHPDGNGLVTANAGASRWYKGTPGIVAWDYQFSAPQTVIAIAMLLESAPDPATLTTTGLVVTVTPSGTPVTISSAVLQGRILTLNTAPTVIAPSDRIQVNFTRSASTTLPITSVSYNIPQPTDLSERVP